ncbi:hypothetical protein FB451DRAFT_1404064 [Mycena latifolia]|nr:hypothetical protein FB451DRAFT_1404064 [Mycena latifolia]
MLWASLSFSCIAVVALAVLARAPFASRRASSPLQTSPHSCAISAQDPSDIPETKKFAFAQVWRDALQIHARDAGDSVRGRSVPAGNSSRRDELLFVQRSSSAAVSSRVGVTAALHATNQFPRNAIFCPILD